VGTINLGKRGAALIITVRRETNTGEQVHNMVDGRDPQLGTGRCWANDLAIVPPLDASIDTGPV